MENNWYYVDDEYKRQGPFTLDQLKTKDINKNTLVWTDGMSDWEKAVNIPILQDVWSSKPPPIPEEEKTGNATNESNEKSNNKQSPETQKIDFGEATWKSFVLAAFVFLLNYGSFSGIIYSRPTYMLIIFSILYILAISSVLKSLIDYLNTFNGIYYLDNIIYLIISLNIFLLVFDLFFLEGALWTDNTFLNIILVVLPFTLVISSVILSFRLLAIDNDYSGLIKTFAGSFLFGLIFGIICYGLYETEKDDKFLFAGSVVSTLPYLLLGVMFYITGQKANSSNINTKDST